MDCVVSVMPMLMYRIGGNDVVGVFVIDKTGEVVACKHSHFWAEAYELAKGDVNDVSTTQVLQLEQSFKGDEGTGAFKLGQRYGTSIRNYAKLTWVRKLLLRREGEILIAVLKNNVSRRYSNHNG
jgi:hypothetical protein